MDHNLSHIRALFDEIIQAQPGARAALLDARCGPDAALRQRIEALIAMAEADGPFLADPTRSQASPVAAIPATAMTSVMTERPGTRIGPFKLLPLIGEGGFGVVFMAEQSEPVRRRVALKIIKLGMDTRQVVARFEQERQALALMDHPHIARVLDAGSTASGRPYFVMEYVQGDPITSFADAHRLSVPERLDLFSQVCQAVQHAHTKGVIHRDLKPRNVLVSMTDGKPFAKVIDFGIAKATGARLTDKTLFTEHRQLIGTPEYMSPEQAEGSPDIDTRTDVYSLGVLLYELLTGATPFDGERLRSAAWGEMQRIIREEDPPAPSLRISRDLATLAATAQSRRAEPAKLGPAVRGELDWIVMKALDKDRSRRYESPSQFAADVQRHLAGEAVIAAPISTGYRLRKFVRRNKGAVTAGTAVIVALMLGGGAATWQWQRARAFNAEAEHQAYAAGYNATAAQLARERAEVQRDFAARLGRALLAVLKGESSHPDLDYIENVAATPEPEPGPYDPVIARQDVGQDLKSLARISIDAARDVTRSRERALAQLSQVEDGIGRMMGILTDNTQVGALVSRDEDGRRQGEDDPVGYAIAFGIQLAESLKDEREELKSANASLLRQRDIARKAMNDMSAAVSCDVCPPEEQHLVAQAFLQGWRQFHADQLAGKSEDEIQLLALGSFGVSQARSLREETKRARLAEAKALYERFSRHWELSTDALREEARQQLDAVIQARTELLGPGHIDTVKATWARAMVAGDDFDSLMERAAVQLEQAGHEPDEFLIGKYAERAGAFTRAADPDTALRWVNRLNKVAKRAREAGDDRTLGLIKTVLCNSDPGGEWSSGAGPGLARDVVDQWLMSGVPMTRTHLLEAEANRTRPSPPR